MTTLLEFFRYVISNCYCMIFCTIFLYNRCLINIIIIRCCLLTMFINAYHVAISYIIMYLFLGKFRLSRPFPGIANPNRRHVCTVLSLVLCIVCKRDNNILALATFITRDGIPRSFTERGHLFYCLLSQIS